LRKLVSIAFLILFLFNVGGYYLVFTGLKIKTSHELTHRLAVSGYQKDEAFIFKIPLVLPYPITQQGFQPASGEFEQDGEFYSLIEQKLENDTLTVVCIKNHHKKELHGLMEDFSRWANDAPQSEQSALNLVSKLFKDYTSQTLTVSSVSAHWCYELSYFEMSLPIQVRAQFIDSPPPEGSIA
jgi:hypothetical protein